jgi:hypothetical protein
MMKRLGIAQRERFWKIETFLDTILRKSGRSCRNFVIENHRF